MKNTCIKYTIVFDRKINFKVRTRRIKILPKTKEHLDRIIKPILNHLSCDKYKIEFRCFQYYRNEKLGFSNLRISMHIKNYKNKNSFDMVFYHNWNPEHLQKIKFFQDNDYQLFENDFNDFLKTTDKNSFYISQQFDLKIPINKYNLSYKKNIKRTQILNMKTGVLNPNKSIFSLKSYNFLKNREIKNHYIFYSNIINYFNSLDLEIHYLIDEQGIAYELKNFHKNNETDYIDITSEKYTWRGVLKDLLFTDSILLLDDYENLTLKEIAEFNNMMNY